MADLVLVSKTQHLDFDIENRSIPGKHGLCHIRSFFFNGEHRAVFLTETTQALANSARELRIAKKSTPREVVPPICTCRGLKWE